MTSRSTSTKTSITFQSVFQRAGVFLFLYLRRHSEVRTREKGGLTLIHLFWLLQHVFDSVCKLLFLEIICFGKLNVFVLNSTFNLYKCISVLGFLRDSEMHYTVLLIIKFNNTFLITTLFHINLFCIAINIIHFSLSLQLYFVYKALSDSSRTKAKSISWLN